ncbi:UNVERIFIED_CONTAM: hypothetical protein HDU68_005298, partial [Siphonaria sp. JEL0065]
IIDNSSEDEYATANTILKRNMMVDESHALTSKELVQETAKKMLSTSDLATYKPLFKRRAGPLSTFPVAPPACNHPCSATITTRLKYTTSTKSSKQDRRNSEAIIRLYNDISVFGVPDVSSRISENISSDLSELEDEGDGAVEADLESELVAEDNLACKKILDLIIVAMEAKESESNSWKVVEDLFWIKTDLDAMIGYSITEWKQSFWVDLLEIVENDESLSSQFHAVALLHIDV